LPNVFKSQFKINTNFESQLEFVSHWWQQQQQQQLRIGSDGVSAVRHRCGMIQGHGHGQD